MRPNRNENMEENAPIVHHPTDEQALFMPSNLLERAAAMQGKEPGRIPSCCVLDFDGELIPVARERFRAEPCPEWPCFHTGMLRIRTGNLEMGLIGGTVGAPFAVLVAEQLIAWGCRFIIGYSSAGALSGDLPLPCLVIPDRAWRDEGTSYHYLPPSEYVTVSGILPGVVARFAGDCGLPVRRGATWTTDAPYRETRSQIERHRAAGLLSVEMEAAALMALARVRHAEIASLLHVTNAFATAENDFHKGPEDTHEKLIGCCLNAFADAMSAGAAAMGSNAHEDA